ncbi:MAG: hypothetical protein JWO31_1086, partial [Phycisphaerales bacterium]|nr:hypothetical protein [Phycisphaerales bacterium]
RAESGSVVRATQTFRPASFAPLKSTP